MWRKENSDISNAIHIYRTSIQIVYQKYLNMFLITAIWGHLNTSLINNYLLSDNDITPPSFISHKFWGKKVQTTVQNWLFERSLSPNNMDLINEKRNGMYYAGVLSSWFRSNSRRRGNKPARYCSTNQQIIIQYRKKNRMMYFHLWKCSTRPTNKSFFTEYPKFLHHK